MRQQKRQSAVVFTEHFGQIHNAAARVKDHGLSRKTYEHTHGGSSVNRESVSADRYRASSSQYSNGMIHKYILDIRLIFTGRLLLIKVRPSSHQTYRGYIDNHIKPNIGSVPLGKLTSLDLQKLYKTLLEGGRVARLEALHQPKGLSAKTVRNIYTKL